MSTQKNKYMRQISIVAKTDEHLKNPCYKSKMKITYRNIKLKMIYLSSYISDDCSCQRILSERLKTGNRSVTLYYNVHSERIIFGMHKDEIKQTKMALQYIKCPLTPIGVLAGVHLCCSGWIILKFKNN